MTTKLIISLLKLPSIGLQTASRIIEKSNGEEINGEDLFRLIQKSQNEIKRINGINLSDVISAIKEAEKELDICSNSGIEVIPYKHSNYPQRFNNLTKPPLIIYAKGNVNNLNNELSVAVIGTRKPTDFGMRAGYKLTKYFVEKGFTIVSGLATGCDYIGHKCCLDHNGKTVAVLANGLDIVYPKQNSNLAEEILEREGTLISEYPIGTAPRSNYFIERDRLQSGLSNGVCIIETERAGGTMHTFNYAIEQNKVIGALSHPSTYQSQKSLGNKYIIEERGGHSLGSSADIENFIELLIHNENRSRTKTPKSKFDPSNTQFGLFD